MLDTTTKKNINDCRDILVGKLPDPKAQIEQITIGLIYKFMNDMDAEAIELGGKAKFFADYKIPDLKFPNNRKKDQLVPFSHYAWDHLLGPKVTAAEMLQLYSQAIESMAKNPNIPMLFRDIFKNAYLPYRDPETLKLFLKTINRFEYTHSEDLGDAFEYLLLVMGAQGDAGQFRTPRHIIDFIVAVVDPDKKDSVLDPACGTAGFLISAFKHIRQKDKKGLTPDERKKLIQNFTGYDISPDMVRLSLVNLYLHGFSDPHIYEYDTLSSEKKWNDNFDVILANPPFMSPKGGIRPHKKFAISSNRSEVLFVDYIAEHLNPKGRAGVIVPEGVIFQSGTAYKQLRKMLVENYLYAVVSLPAGVFNPYSGVKTSILLMDKALAKKNDEILFVKIDNDGYSLGAQRTPVKGGRLGKAITLLHQFKSGGPLTEAEMAHAVAKTEIAKNGDYNLSGERYKVHNVVQSDFPLVELRDVAEYINGFAFKPSDWEPEGLPIIRIQNLTKSSDSINYTMREDIPDKYIVENGDLLISWSATIGFYLWNEGKAYLNQHIFKVVPNKKIRKLYLYHLGGFIRKEILKSVHGNTMTHITKGKFDSIQIPLPPLSVQEEIVSEIDSYQKIIDGAKAVVNNYKPRIDIDPEWEMVELGEVCKNLQYGSSKKSNLRGDIVCLRMGNIQNGEIDWSNLKYAPNDEDIEKYILKPKDVLFNRTNSPVHVGKTGIYRGERKAVFAGYLIRLNYKRNLILGDFLNYCLNTKEAKDFCLRVKTDGINQSNINAKILATFQIPLPEIETQHQIVTQIEKEQELVNANKQLIEIFEQKIKDRIAKVWGA